MAKKPGLMNASKGMDPMKVANVMAKAATIKAQSMGKSFKNGADGAEDQPTGTGDIPNPGKDGTQHPTAPARQASSYKGEMHDEMSGGAVHPSTKKKSSKQVAAMKEEGK